MIRSSLEILSGSLQFIAKKILDVNGVKDKMETISEKPAELSGCEMLIEEANEGVEISECSSTNDRTTPNAPENGDCVETPSETPGRHFADTFKNILSSVLKTDLGQVLKNRNEKNVSVGKGVSESFDGLDVKPADIPFHIGSDKLFNIVSSSEDGDASENLDDVVSESVVTSCDFVSPVLTRASSKSILSMDVYDDLKDDLEGSSAGTSDGKKVSETVSTYVRPKLNRARKCITLPRKEDLVRDADSNVKEAEDETLPLANVAKFRGRQVNEAQGKGRVIKGRRRRRFKGGTYPLSIRPMTRKKIKRPVMQTKCEPESSIETELKDGDGVENIDGDEMSVGERSESLVEDSNMPTQFIAVSEDTKMMDDEENERDSTSDANASETAEDKCASQNANDVEELLNSHDNNNVRSCSPTDGDSDDVTSTEPSIGLTEESKENFGTNEDDKSTIEETVPLASISNCSSPTAKVASRANSPVVSSLPTPSVSSSPTSFQQDSEALGTYVEPYSSPIESPRQVCAIVHDEMETKEDAMDGCPEITEGGLTQDQSEGRMSVALSVKRRHGLKRKKFDGEESENDMPTWCSNTEQVLPKRAKKVAVARAPFSLQPSQGTYDTNPPLQLCTCEENCSPPYNTPVVKETYCQAIDCIDDRIVGCCNLVTRPLLNRPSRVIPFTAMCEVHRSRLRSHHCCPGCGLFCTQGVFVKCNDSASKDWHLFHERCCLVSNGEGLCPHCGLPSEWIRVRLRISGVRPLVFYPKQQHINKGPAARMSITRCNETGEEDNEAIPQKTYKLASTGKEISVDGLPFGPDRTQLEALLVNLALEKPMNLRYVIKSMYNAAKSNDVEKILHMLAMRFDPNHKFEEHDNETALHAACSAGNLVIVHVLHQAGAYLDISDNKLRTPLMLTVETKQVAVIQYLIRSGAHVEARGEDGMTVLHLAAKAGNLEACKLLIDTRRININIQDDGGWTPLVWAAEHRHRDIADFLLDNGSDPYIRDNEQNIALHWAAFSGSLEICEKLLNTGCDVNSVNEHGDTPLHIAARQDNYDCVILFLARNAEINIINKENELPIKCCPDENSQTWMALSMNAKLKEFARMRNSRSEIMLHKDISLGKESNPIPCVNGVDDESFPTDYLYIIENCETSPINVERSITSLQTCQCEDDCSSINCPCSCLSLRCWYTKEGGLAPEFNLLDPPMIFECNRACRCWKSCSNRVIQHGISSRLQLFRTKGKGWGVRTLRDIPRGTFICEYIGEVISDSEADHREDDSYLFDLDNRDGETYCIDARHYGNVSRFINHLCEPNLVPVKVFIDHQDLRFPRIAFFSSRDIKAYEELGFDYGEKFWIIKYKTFTCMCHSEKCKYSADKIQEMLENYMRRQREEIEI